MVQIAGLDDVRHRTGNMRRVDHREAGLMAFRIERLAEGIKARSEGRV